MFMAVSCAYLLNLALLFTPSLSSAANASTPAQVDGNPVFVKINDREIRLIEFQQIFQNAVRNKFYHGQVPEAELKAFQQKVTSDIVDQVLLRQEAKKLNIQPDVGQIEEGLAQYDQRYSMSPNWQPRTEAEKKIIIERLSQKNVIDQVEARVKDIARPTLEKVREYYLANPDKFTEPKRLHVSVILLPVPPSSLSDAWQEAEQVALTLIERINNGENFADMAKEYSAHASAINGGDLGYLHQDMLETNAQQAVDKLEVGQMTAPIRVLRGYTIFKLNEVRESRLNAFEVVQQRAGDLLYRDMQNDTWKTYISDLRKNADIYINDDLLAAQ